MEIPYRFRIILEIYAAVASAFLLTHYGFFPLGIVLGVGAVIFLDVLLPDEGNFKN